MQLLVESGDDVVALRLYINSLDVA